MFFRKKYPRKIFFVVSNRRWGTFYLRGVQICRELNRSGFNCSVIRTRQLPKVRNSILVFVKRLTPNSIDIARNNENRIVWDILDGYMEEPSDHAGKLGALDGLILSTAASERFLPDHTVEEKVIIYHHIDPRVVPRTGRPLQNSRFSLCYIGNIPYNSDNTGFLDAFHDIAIIETNTRHAERNGWMKRIAPYNCHFAVRLETPHSQMKPLAKVGVAAACRANIIVNRSNAAVELLGDDYPFICEDSVESAQEMINRARNRFGLKEWINGLAQMDRLRERLSLSSSVQEYAGFLKRFF